MPGEAMKIWLLYPRTDDMISTELPGFVAKEVGRFPPLGLLYLAAYVRKHTRHDVRVIDMPALGMTYDALGEELRAARPEMVGISGTTHNLVEVKRAADCVKTHSDASFVCLGGPHVNAFPEESLALASVDVAIQGEGERAFLALVNAVAAGHSYDDVPGLIRRAGETVTVNPQADVIPDLDELPFPARDLVDTGAYYYVLGRRATFTTLLTTRGCPFRCIFCSTPHGKFRMRSPANIADEIEACMQDGAEDFHFIDDTFNVSIERVRALCREFLDRDLRIKWSFRGRVDTVDLDTLRLARKAGCTRIHFGIETGTDEGLRLLRKGITVRQAEDAIRSARRAGIATAAYFMIGCPHETTREDVLQTVAFACRIRPDFAMFNVMTIYPHTELLNLATERSLIKKSYWSEFARNPTPDFQLKFWEEHLSKDELNGLLQMAYRRFYFRPSVVLRNLVQTRSLGALRHKAAAAVSLLRESLS